jgi:hypothetical protein
MQFILKAQLGFQEATAFAGDIHVVRSSGGIPHLKKSSTEQETATGGQSSLWRYGLFAAEPLTSCLWFQDVSSPSHMARMTDGRELR